MASKKQIGPVTTHVAQELRAQRARLQMSYDELSARSGVSKPTVIGCLKGERTMAFEVYIALCKALELDPGKLIDDAVAATRTPDSRNPTDRPASLQEIKQHRLQAQAQPMAGAADGRPMMEQDDDWEPR